MIIAIKVENINPEGFHYNIVLIIWKNTKFFLQPIKTILFQSVRRILIYIAIGI